MGYISGYCCDRCEITKTIYNGRAVSPKGAAAEAREAGWMIWEYGWLCPKCKKAVLDYAKPKRCCDDGT